MNNTIKDTEVRVTRIYSPSQFRQANPKGAFIKAKDYVCAAIDGNKKCFKTGLGKYTKAELEKYDAMIGEEPGTLYNNGLHSKFWQTYQIIIPKNGMTLMLDNPKDWVAYHVLSARNNVALSQEDLKLKAHSGNEAVYLITNEEREAEASGAELSFKVKALVLFNEMSPEALKDFLVFTGHNPFNMSPKEISAHAGRFADTDPKAFLKILNTPHFQDQVFIEKLCHYNILSKKGGAIYQGESCIATDVQNTIAHLNSPKGNSEKIALLAALQEKEEGGKRAYPANNNKKK